MLNSRACRSWINKMNRRKAQKSSESEELWSSEVSKTMLERQLIDWNFVDIFRATGMKNLWVIWSTDGLSRFSSHFHLVFQSYSMWRIRTSTFTSSTWRSSISCRQWSSHGSVQSWSPFYCITKLQPRAEFANFIESFGIKRSLAR